MIIHVFYLPNHHLNLSIIESFVCMATENDDIKLIFLIVGSEKQYYEIYEKRFRELKIENFLFIDRLALLWNYARRNRSQSYLLHGIPYKYIACLVLSNIEKLNWVCWGAGARINRKNAKSILFTPVKKFLYKNFSSVLTLMTGDKISLEHDFKLDNVRVMPYFSIKHTKLRDMFYSLLRNPSINRGRIRVLLGNNSWCLPTYYDLLKKISKYNATIEVHCMLQYPKIGEKEKNKILSLGESLFGKYFFLDMEILPTEEYIHYMNSFDIYICACEEQSGLGAVSTCLKLGKKIYLAGLNYDWIASQKFCIFHIEDINADDFLIELSQKDKAYNIDRWYYTRSFLKGVWIDYLREIGK
ncbi:TDP-N-acetylfucosamine:lipid II N-acetylfucosaminyltransferase [Phocaeicola sp.]